MIARKLQTYLESIPALQDVLSAPKWGLRVRVGRIPQGMLLPYVRLAEIGADVSYHLAGELSGLDTTVQIDVWAETEKQADEIADLIRGFDADGNLIASRPLSGFAGTWDGARVEAVVIMSETGTVEEPGDSSGAGRFRNTRDYRIHWHRAVSPAN